MGRVKIYLSLIVNYGLAPGNVAAGLLGALLGAASIKLSFFDLLLAFFGIKTGDKIHNTLQNPKYFFPIYR
jgi:hypothetical protein